MEHFSFLSSGEVGRFNDGLLIRFIGHFPNCYDQTFYMIRFLDKIEFFFPKIQLATDFLYKFSKHHSLNFYKRRFNKTYSFSFVEKLLFDESINRTRFENPDKHKVIEYFASCCSFNFELVPNGESHYALVPIEKSRE